MYSKKVKYIFGNLCFFILTSSNLFSQNKHTIDNFFKDIAKKYYDYEIKDSVLSREYAFKYLTEAKKNNDSEKIANGYYFVSRFLAIHQNNGALKYADSAISLTKNANTKHLPFQAYMNKASFYYVTGNLESSLENYIIANEYAVEQNDEISQNNIKYFISVLKNRLGHYREAIALSKEVFTFFQEKHDVEHLDAVFNLASSYNKLKLYDSAFYYNNLGHKLSLDLNNDLMKNYFVLNQGVNHIGMKEYGIALDSLKNAMEYIENEKDIPNIILTKYYLGITYNKLNDIDKSIFHFKEMDSILVNSNEAIQEVRKGYELLIDYYKKKGNINKQLLYVNRLLKYDSLYYSNYRELSKNITKRYDTRALENEKNDLQQQLVIAAEKEKSSKWKIIFLIIIVIISTLIIYYNHRKKLFYKKRFEELISDDYKKQNKTQNIQEKSLGIPEEIVISILDKLSLFETKKEFLEQELTREILAQKFGTNTKYISKIINHYKNKNFRDYINDLRIEYSVKELKKNAELRKYTIKSIANEIGYKSVDSFSKAFKKHTGVQVSYFIRELKKS